MFSPFRVGIAATLLIVTGCDFVDREADRQREEGARAVEVTRQVAAQHLEALRVDGLEVKEVFFDFDPAAEPSVEVSSSVSINEENILVVDSAYVYTLPVGRSVVILNRNGALQPQFGFFALVQREGSDEWLPIDVPKAGLWERLEWRLNGSDRVLQGKLLEFFSDLNLARLHTPEMPSDVTRVFILPMSQPQVVSTDARIDITLF